MVLAGFATSAKASSRFAVISLTPSLMTVALMCCMPFSTIALVWPGAGCGTESSSTVPTMYTGLLTSKFIRRSSLPEFGSFSEKTSANNDWPSPGVAVHWNRTGLETVPPLIGPISSEVTNVLPAAEEP